MFCPGCGKNIEETESFCRHCGKGTATPQGLFHRRFSRSSILVAVLVLILLGVVVSAYWNADEHRADHAIDAAVEACAQGGKREFDRRMVEARLAIHDLESTEWPIYETKLDNRLLQMGCPTHE